MCEAFERFPPKKEPAFQRLDFFEISGNKSYIRGMWALMGDSYYYCITAVCWAVEVIISAKSLWQELAQSFPPLILPNGHSWGKWGNRQQDN